MINLLKKMMGMTPGVNLCELIRQGATIVDVRTKGEYQQGHIKGSVNIPLDQLENKAAQLKGKEPLILCCASGMRSSSGTRILKAKGFSEVYNGGGWGSLNCR